MAEHGISLAVTIAFRKWKERRGFTEDWKSRRIQYGKNASSEKEEPKPTKERKPLAENKATNAQWRATGVCKTIEEKKLTKAQTNRRRWYDTKLSKTNGARTDEERKRARGYHAKRVASFSPRQKKAYLEKRNKNQKAWKARLKAAKEQTA